MKTRVQHPKVIERSDRTGSYWYFRYYADELQPGGSMKTVRKFQKLGPSKGEKRLTRKEAEIARDRSLAGLNTTTEQEVVAAKGLVLFKEAADMYVKSHLERKNRIAAPSREKAISHLELHIVPKWGSRRLIEIRPKDVEDWLYDTFDSWWMSTLHLTPYGARRITRGQDGSLLLSCRTLSFSTPCRLIPALSVSICG